MAKTLKDYEYYRTELGVLYCGDCLDILPLIQDKVDLVLTDPPYNVNKNIKNDNLSWDEWDVWFSKIIDLMNKYKRYYFFTGGKHLNRILPMTKRYLDNFVFYKPFANNRGYITDWNLCDFIVAAGEKDVLKTKNNFFEYKEFPDISGKPHPTTKPLKIIEKLVMCLSKPNDLILDLFFCSGTTGLACEKLGRRWIGIEISEEYCKIAKKRIEQEANQMKLFK